MRLIFVLLLVFSSLNASSREHLRDRVLLDKILFVGSSSIDFWRQDISNDFPDRQIVNRGVAGTDYQFLVKQIKPWLETDTPDRIVVYSGDNDIASGKSPAQILKDFKNLIQEIKQFSPKIDVYVLSVKPCLAADRWAKIESVKNLNQLLFAESRRHDNVIFVDVFHSMLDSRDFPRADLFQKDGIHLSRSGYILWREILQSAFDRRRGFLFFF